MRQIAAAMPCGEAALPLFPGALLLMNLIAWPFADLGLEPTLFGTMMAVIVPVGLRALGAAGPRLWGQIRFSALTTS